MEKKQYADETHWKKVELQVFLVAWLNQKSLQIASVHVFLSKAEVAQVVLLVLKLAIAGKNQLFFAEKVREEHL